MAEHGAGADASPLGFLGDGSPATIGKLGPKLSRRSLGYVEWQEYLIEFQWTDGSVSRLADVAAELLRRSSPTHNCMIISEGAQMHWS